MLDFHKLTNHVTHTWIFKHRPSRMVVLLGEIRQSLTTIPIKKINMIAYFENLTIELQVLYVLNTRVKFSS